MLPDTERKGARVINTTVPPKRKMSRDPAESPEYGTAGGERGRSLHHKSKSDLQFPASPGRRCPGSWSYTLSRQCSKSRNSTPSQSCQRDSTPHTSRKHLVTKLQRPAEAMPTQSLAQKTPKLKSLVQRAPATRNYRNPPYKSPETDPREFIRYLMRNLDRKAYDIEIRSLATFSSQATVIVRHVIASTITTLVAANRGIHFLALVIPRELMNIPPNPPDAELMGPPACSKDYQMDVRVHCIREWMYVMCLLQYWFDAGSVYTYGGPV